MVDLNTSSADELAGQFIRLCLRSRLSNGAMESVRNLAVLPGFAWEQLASMAAQERVSALLYDILHGRNIVPLEVEKALRERYNYEIRRSLFLQNELIVTVGLLAEAAVEVIILKGAALAIEIYGDMALRPMRDVDLLVHRDRMPAAREALLSLGYTQGIEPFSGAALLFENEIAFGKPGFGDGYLEFHWSLFDSPYYQRLLPLSWFWQTARPIRLGNTPALILAPEAQILHLCGHLALHHAQDAKLLWLNDVAEVIQHYSSELDWELLLAQVQNYHLVLPVRQVLTQAVDELRASVPDHVLDKLSSIQPTPEEEQVYAWHTAEQRSVAQRIWSDIAHIPGLRGQIRYVLARLFPSPDYMMPRYQIWHWTLLPFYYLYHFFVGLFSTFALILRR